MTVTGTQTNVASVCLIDLGSELDVASGGTLNNYGPHNNDGILLNEGTLSNAGTINQFCLGPCPGTSENTVYNALSTLYNFGQINGGAVLDTGLIINFGGASLNGITLTNAFDSSIIYNAGDISLSSASPNNGSIENLSGGSLEIEPASGSGLTNGGTLLNDAGATITNSGGL